ncbi:hypothetical protein M9H77_07006 [Catharanthus roseus]|uniref:Uncharacterized protein n=1 Tax=Catharanthus roseus TaxID=4058 RepID=A0ACC0BTU6_CATRO|nr:hypothetical protein M9H77_07006 [Catharanthus roseus]
MWIKTHLIEVKPNVRVRKTSYKKHEILRRLEKWKLALYKDLNHFNWMFSMQVMIILPKYISLGRASKSSRVSALRPQESPVKECKRGEKEETFVLEKPEELVFFFFLKISAMIAVFLILNISIYDHMEILTPRTILYKQVFDLQEATPKLTSRVSQDPGSYQLSQTITRG